MLPHRYLYHPPRGDRHRSAQRPLTIPPETAILPDLAKQAGYRTAAIGKWHLGLGGPGGPDWNGEIKPGPLEIGFDHAFLLPTTNDRVPQVYLENHRADVHGIPHVDLATLFRVYATKHSGLLVADNATVRSQAWRAGGNSLSGPGADEIITGTRSVPASRGKLLHFILYLSAAQLHQNQLRRQ